MAKFLPVQAILGLGSALELPAKRIVERVDPPHLHALGLGLGLG
jgi:hypothetical protein